jgi:hypothetical protein
MLGRYGLKPHRLPDATAGRVPDHPAAVQGLLSDRDLSPTYHKR